MILFLIYVCSFLYGVVFFLVWYYEGERREMISEKDKIAKELNRFHKGDNFSTNQLDFLLNCFRGSLQRGETLKDMVRDIKRKKTEAEVSWDIDDLEKKLRE